jgi:hypothetical protein
VCAAAGVQARSPDRKQDVHRILRSIFAIDFIECVQWCIGMFISSTDGIMLSFSLISRCNEPRSDR